MRLEDMERVGPVAREGRTQVGRVHHRLVWGGVGLTLGLRRPSVTFTRVKACWDGVHSRREMETVGTDGFTRSPTGKQRNWVVAGKEFTGSRAFFSKGELVLGLYADGSKRVGREKLMMQEENPREGRLWWPPQTLRG